MKRNTTTTEQIKKLTELKEKIQKEVDDAIDTLASASESFNCGYPEIDAKKEKIQNIDRAINILKEVETGTLIISETHKKEVDKTIKKLKEDLKKIEADLSDALAMENTIHFGKELITKGFIHDCTYDLTICRCECHRNKDVNHFVACCNDVCSKCNKHILPGMLKAHMKTHN